MISLLQALLTPLKQEPAVVQLVGLEVEDGELGPDLFLLAELPDHHLESLLSFRSLATLAVDGRYLAVHLNIFFYFSR